MLRPVMRAHWPPGCSNTQRCVPLETARVTSPQRGLLMGAPLPLLLLLFLLTSSLSSSALSGSFTGYSAHHEPLYLETFLQSSAQSTPVNFREICPDYHRLYREVDQINWLQARRSWSQVSLFDCSPQTHNKSMRIKSNQVSCVKQTDEVRECQQSYKVYWSFVYEEKNQSSFF